MCVYVYVSVDVIMSIWVCFCVYVYLSYLLANQGENPKVQHTFRRGRALRRGLEVDQKDVSKKEEEEEVHQHVTKEGGNRCKPELPPSVEHKGTLLAGGRGPCGIRANHKQRLGNCGRSKGHMTHERPTYFWTCPLKRCILLHLRFC